jgi:hypothetical protein
MELGKLKRTYTIEPARDPVPERIPIVTAPASAKDAAAPVQSRRDR